MLVRPAASHAAYDRQSVIVRCAAMFTGSWLTDAQLGVLTTAPMDREHNIARIIIDIDNETRLRQWFIDEGGVSVTTIPYSDWLISAVADRLGTARTQIMERIEVRPGVTWEEPMLREEKGIGDFAKSAAVASEVLAYNMRAELEAPGVFSRLGEVGLKNWFAARWGVRSDEMGAATRARGFPSMHEFFETARVGFLFDALSAKPLRENDGGETG